MLRWMRGNTRRDKMINKDILADLSVAPKEKTEENRIWLFGNMQRRPTDAQI